MSLKLFKNLFFTLKKIIKLYTPGKTYFYKIEEINECTNRIVLSCRGKGATIVTTIEDIGYDYYIINFLPPHHACWVGYYFGKKWSQEKEDKRTAKIYDTLFPQQDDSNYKIICQNRTGEIIYQNSNSGIVYTMNPMELAKSKTIAKFNPSQAFYIGFLAALKSVKTANKKLKVQTKFPYHLRIVK